MNSFFHNLTIQHLDSLEQALKMGRLSPPYSVVAVEHFVPRQLKNELLQELNTLNEQGMTPQHIAFSLQLLRDEKSIQQKLDNRLEWVWTGPELSGSTARDTAIVVQELFRLATTSVLIASYSLDQPTHTHAIFGELAEKMDEDEELSVRFFLNIKRRYQENTDSSLLLKKFARNFREKLWPGKRLPELFYDPRSLEINHQTRTSLHAKCIIIDSRYSFVTSANFSEAAHQRNIEAGVLLDDTNRAVALQKQFDTLVEKHFLLKLH